MATEDVSSTEDILVEEGEVAGDYLEQLLDILDFDGDIDLDVEGDRAMVNIDGSDDLKALVGRNGEVLEALQELSRLTVQQELGVRSRLMLDIAGWRAQRREDLANTGRNAAEEAKATGSDVELPPMSPFERKVIHDVVADIPGVRSDSKGEEPHRLVVVIPEA